MALVTAKNLENLNFKFFQLRKLAVTDNLDTNVINNLAISHTHQVIFAAYGNAFKVIRISTLLDYEWDKKVVDTIVNSYPALEIKLPYKPSLLSVSGGTNSTLLVFGQNSSNNLSGDIFDIPTLLSGNPNPISRLEFPPTISLNVYIQSVAWHPDFAETLFAATTSNGALVTIGIDQQTKGVQLLAHYSDSFKFTCASWSPKGKQIVVGGDNGQLTQFKHSNGKGFQKAKVIPSPLPNHKIVNVNWVHSALFQVAYVHNSATNSPDTRVIFVHAPPKAVPEYHDYGYVCMETGKQYEGPDKIRITFSEIGNILLCLSSLSNEVSVIGCDTPEINASPTTWQQWMLDDSSRIELSGSDGSDAYPVGIAWFKGPTKVFKINESVSLGGPGWPLIVVLTSAGLLCPYYACHLQGKFQIPDCPPCQPLPISVPGPTRVNRPDIQTTGQQQQQQVTGQAGVTKSQAQTFPGQQSQPSVDASFTFSLPKTGQEKPKPQTTVTVAATVQAPSQQQQQVSQQQAQHQQQLAEIQAAQQAQQLQQQQQQQQQQAPSKPIISEEELRKKELEVLEETFSMAINEEILEFTKTLQNAKNNFSKALNLQIGKPDELAILQSETASLFELLKTSSDTFKSLDLNMLNGYILETWAMVQEAQTRLEKESDPIYTMMANRRSIDPITARKMREIKKIAHEIEMHLEDLNNMLDREWEDYTAQMNVKKLPTGLSSIDMIYHTLSTHHKTIEMLKKNLSKYDVYLESIELEESGSVSPRRKEIQDIINSLRSSSIQDDNSILSDISRHKSMIKIPTITKEKKEKLLEFFEQRNSVPIRRAILPSDLKSSKMVSAVVKAQERLKQIREKSQIISDNIPVKSWTNVTSGQSKPVDLNTTIQPNQVTPTKSSDQDKSLFYSTAIGDMSINDTSRYQSPVKNLNFLSPITTKTDPRLASKSQQVGDKSIFKEPEPADKSTPFASKTDPKDDSFSLSFASTTLGNIASPTPSSSTFLFGQSSVKPTEKGFASTFATATKDISIISKDKDTPSTISKENVQPKVETKPVTSSVSSTSVVSTITSASSAVSSPKPATAFPTFTFTSQSNTSTASTAPAFSFRPTAATTSVAASPSAANISISSTASTVPISKSNTSNAPFSFSTASGFSMSTTANASSLFGSPTPSAAQSANDTKTSISTSLFSTEKPSSTTGFSFGDATPSAAPSFSFGGTLGPSTVSSTSTSASTVTSTTVSLASVATTTTTASTTTASTVSSSSTTTTITPVPGKPFDFGTSTGQVSSANSITSTQTATPPVFSLGVKSEPNVGISATSSSTTVISPAGESVASTATTVTPVFTSVASSSAPLNLTSGSSIFSTSATSLSSSTTTITAVSPSNSVFGLGASTNAQQQVAVTTPTSPSLFGGPQNTTAFFTPTTPTSFTSQVKTNEPVPAFNFNTALANLGGQPSQNSTPSNPFGSGIGGQSPQVGLFSPKPSAQPFGSPSSMSASFASQGPGVAQTGFGSFSNQNQPRFGAQPTFGGAPAFGAQPTFGGSPTFGSGLPFGKTAQSATLGFGQSAVTPTAAAAPSQPVVQPTATASPFGGFANSNAPSFGALASQQAPTFGQLATQQPPIQQQQQQQQSTGSIFGGFGGQPAALSTSPSIFGNSFPSAPSFGSPQFSQRRQ